MTTPPSRRFLILDVFSAVPFAGNQLAVLPDADGLDAETMQRIAREFNFSETTFVLPAQRPDTDCRVRMFTPSRELPMAGHPTVGTAFARAHEGTIDADCPHTTFGLGVGPTTVELEWIEGRLAFAWMTQPLPAFGPEVTDIAALADAVGLDAAALEETGLPVLEGSAGVPYLYLPVASRELVDAASVDEQALADASRTVGLRDLPVVLFTLEPGEADDDAAVYSRMFAPMFGVPEDPATGSAAGPLGAYLVQHGAVSAERARRMVDLQGVAMGRPSRITLSIETDGDGRVTRVRIGGQAVVVATGTLFV